MSSAPSWQVSDAARALGDDGVFTSSMADFAPRQVQQRMAAAVEAAIEDQSQLVIEAGTGTGKTFAYLLPALLSGKRVIISTGTKTLQDQLFHRDLPQVRKLLGARVSAALLKGRANYLCTYRLEKTLSEGGLHSRAEVAQLAKVKTWSKRTRTGEISEVVSVSEDATIWPKVTSSAENCLGSECSYFAECHVFAARRAAQEADIVVVNHHLLFADLAIKREGFGEILPGVDAFVLDEAHQIPELAGQFFSTHLSSRQLLDLSNDALREAAEVTGARAALEGIGQQLEPAIKHLRLALDDVNKRGVWPEILARNEVQKAYAEIDDALHELNDALGRISERSQGLDSCQARAEMLLEHTEILGKDPEPGWVHWYETSERGFVLSATPLDVAEPLQEFRAQSNAAWIYTSATLTVAGDFAHFNKRMGLDDADCLSLPSPFDYANNALAYIPNDLPMPSAFNYTEQVIEAALPVLEASNGRAFLLFTSHRALKQAAELLPTRCAFPLFVQGTAPRAQLLEDFRASGNGILLGAASFWEGVDVRGDALSLVVIDKLPFAAPDDPVLEARIKVSKDNGGNPFSEIQIPAAALSLKQGAGRLIRDVSDRGVLMLCDPRLMSSGYGKLFLRCLPPMPITRELSDVQSFFAKSAVEQSA